MVSRVKAASPAKSLPWGVRTFPTLNTRQNPLRSYIYWHPNHQNVWKPPRVQSYVQVKRGPLLALTISVETDRCQQMAADIYPRPRLHQASAERCMWVISRHSFFFF